MIEEAQSQDEEIEIIKSIYGEENVTISQDEDQILIAVSFLNNITIIVDITSSYPLDHSCISISLKSHDHFLDSNPYQSIVKRISHENPSGNILFQIFEEIKEATIDVASTVSSISVDTTSLIEPFIEVVKKDVSINYLPIRPIVNIVHGPCIMEQKSVFQAHLAKITSMIELDNFRQVLLSDKKIASATHNILAYRLTDHQTQVHHSDYDDDGETAAGGRLAEMIRLMGCENVGVIVTRWFGGILLGPIRFKYICNVARDLLEEQGFANTNANKQQHQKDKKPLLISSSSNSKKK
jgi:hypothetical protein